MICEIRKCHPYSLTGPPFTLVQGSLKMPDLERCITVQQGGGSNGNRGAGRPFCLINLLLWKDVISDPLLKICPFLL